MLTEPGSKPLDEISERNLLWLVERARTHARIARRRRKKLEAQVVLTFDEAGRVHVRFRPEETPDHSEPERV